uniref:Uncharacterized protein n=1 Tax=Peronospora matthiolae TaxID=2874970 RepID=A0AAV1UV34_9STRA
MDDLDMPSQSIDGQLADVPESQFTSLSTKRATSSAKLWTFVAPTEQAHRDILQRDLIRLSHEEEQKVRAMITQEVQRRFW